MAYRSTPPGKEKRGTSPSNVPTRGRSPNPSPKKPASPARTHNNPSPSEKPVPNYLKPTMSMVLSSDISKQQGKKLVLKIDDTARDPALLRRRSFDRPPSTAQLQRSRVSPSPALRSSSSFSGKITGLQRGVPDRNLRTPKEAGKQQTLYARHVNTAKKGGTVSIKKIGMGDNSSRGKGKNVAPPLKVDDNSVPHVLEPGNQSEEEETLLNEDSSLENQELNSYEQTGGGENCDKIVNLAISESMQVTEDKDCETTTFEPSKVLEHQETVTIEQAEEESENKDANSETAIGSSTIKLESIKDTPVEDQEPSNIMQTEGDSEQTDAEIGNSESLGNSENQNEEKETIAESLEAPENYNTSVGVNTDEAQDATQEEPNEEDIITEMKKAINSDAKQAESNEDIVHEMNNAINSDAKQDESNEDIISEMKNTINSDAKQEESNEEDIINETNNAVNSDGSVAGNIHKEVEGKEEMGSSKEDELASGDGVCESTEKDLHQVVVEKELDSPEVHMAHGKSDSPVSNNVIEETASKFREQRKNKVRALAGAFESVISMQEK